MHEKLAKSILSGGNGMNIYRGCTHGCIYCDSRSLCYQMTHDFEDIEVKINAPQLLDAALGRKRKPCMISTGSMSDPYLPLEQTLGLTRQCLEVIEKHGFGLSILTKSDAILRDLDLLASIHKKAKCVVEMTLTTHDEALCKILEPNVCTTKRRVEVLKIMQEHGIPTVVWLSPILPFINDTKENLQGILDACIGVGVQGILCFGFGMTLRSGDREYYYAQLDRHFPGIKERYQEKYGENYVLTSDNNAELFSIFTHECQRQGIRYLPDQVFSYLQDFPQSKTVQQLSLLT